MSTRPLPDEDPRLFRTAWPESGSPKVLRCAGVPIGQLSQSEASSFLIERAIQGPTTPMDVHLCNAYTLAVADKSEQLREVLNDSGLNLPDGMSVLWMNRLFHWGQDGHRERVRGTDLFLTIFERDIAHQLRHYLLGSTPEVLRSLRTNLIALFPGVQIAGTDSPPFRELTDIEREEQLERISASGAQIVWVGLGTPKQDIEAANLARTLPVVVIAVGAAFDFVAGKQD